MNKPVLLLLGALFAGCGFTPGAWVSDACSLLTLAEAQSLAPTVQGSSGYREHSEDDVALQVCEYGSAENMAKVEVLFTIPETRVGDDEVNDKLAGGLPGETSLTPVAGLGDAAVTYVSPGPGLGIRAKSEGDLVDLFVWPVDKSMRLPDLVAAMRTAISRLPPRHPPPRPAIAAARFPPPDD